MTGSKIFALFSALAGAALASGHDLGAVEIERRLYGYEPEPASWCFTYYSCYLAPLETQNLLPGSPVVTTITSIVQVPTTLYPTLPTPILTTPLSGLPTPLSSAPSLSPSPSPLPGPEEIILAIIPTVLGRSLEKRRLNKRDLGGFISDVGSPNPKDCRSATVFRLDTARLQLASRLGASVFADAGTSFTEFRTRESFNAGANIISTTFLDDNLLLRWRNASFSGGEAGFCQVPATGQVYATFVDSPTQWPTGCLPIRLAVLDPRQCVGGDTTSRPLPATTSISSVVASTQTVQSSSSSGRPIPISETSVIPPTSKFTTTPSTPPRPVESSSTKPSSENIPPVTSSASGFPSLPPFVSSTRLSSSSQTKGTTGSTASTGSSQAVSTDSSSQSASTESTSQSASTESTSQSASTESTSQSASTESTSQSASTESTSKSASTDSSSQSASTESTSQSASTESTSQSASTKSTSSISSTESTSSDSSSSATSTSEEPFSTTTMSEITTTDTSSTQTSFTFFGNSTTKG